MSEPTTTDVNEFLGDLDGGVFVEKVARALSDVAAGVIANEKSGKATVQFDVKMLSGPTAQVSIDHKLTFIRPTPKGKVSEENTTNTPMYVGRGGKLSIFQPDQVQMFGKKGEPLS